MAKYGGKNFKKGYDERRNYKGRPSGYKEEYIEEVDKYLEKKHDKYVVKGEDKELKVQLPTIEDFAYNHLDVHHSTVYDWAEKHPHFSDALDKIRKEQKQRLIDSGLANKYNSTIAKLILSANHGMKERKDVTTDDESLSERRDIVEIYKETVGNEENNKKDNKKQEG